MIRIGPKMNPRTTAPEIATALPTFFANSFRDARLASHLALRASRLAFLTSSCLFAARSMEDSPSSLGSSTACGGCVTCHFSLSRRTSFGLLNLAFSFSNFWSNFVEVFFSDLVTRDILDEFVLVDSGRCVVGGFIRVRLLVNCAMLDEMIDCWLTFLFAICDRLLMEWRPDELWILVSLVQKEYGITDYSPRDSPSTRLVAGSWQRVQGSTRRWRVSVQ